MALKAALGGQQLTSNAEIPEDETVPVIILAPVETVTNVEHSHGMLPLLYKCWA